MASPLVGVDAKGDDLPAGSRQAPASWALRLTPGRLPFSRAEGDYYSGLFRILADGNAVPAAFASEKGTEVGGSAGAAGAERSASGPTLVSDPVGYCATGALGQLQGGAGAGFLKRSGLPIEQLREIWRLASGGGKSKRALGIENWLLACKLVSLAQKTGVLDVDRLVNGNDQLEMPNFNLDPDPDLGLGDPSKIVADNAIRVEVRNPVQVGGTLDKHTRFTVNMSTSLGHFTIKEATVQRRYRDFVWLHDRLCTIYPGVVIPPVPGKRIVGNMEDSFVEARRQALMEYLSRVVHHPRLVQSFDVSTFLTASTDGLEALKSIIETGVSRGQMDLAAAGAKEAFSNFFTSISSSVSPLFDSRAGIPADIGVDEKYKALCDKHSEMHELLAKAVERANGLEVLRRQSAYHMARLGVYVTELAQHENRGERVGSAAFSARIKRIEQRAREDGGGGGWGDSGWGGSTADASWAGAKPAEEPKSKPVAPASTALVNPNVGIVDFTRATDQAAALFDVEEDVYGGRGEAEELASRTEIHAAASAPVVTVSEPPVSFSTSITSETKTAADALRKLGSSLEASSNRQQDQLDRCADIFFYPLRFELDQANAVREAMARRDSYLSRLAAGHAYLKTKKKHYAQARAESDPASGVAADVKRAEVDVATVERNVGAITESLKLEMTVRETQRRSHLARMMLDYVKAESRNCKLRADRWIEIRDALTTDEAHIYQSLKRIGVETRHDREESKDAEDAEPSPFA